MSHLPDSVFEDYLADFRDHPPLDQRVLHVLRSLPTVVQRDFLDDPRFCVSVERFVPGRGWTVFMSVPGSLGSGSRSVILRTKLARTSEAFACWVIAHEFAHAFLRHGDGGEMENCEAAADELAASWGFPRPLK